MTTCIPFIGVPLDYRLKRYHMVMILMAVAVILAAPAIALLSLVRRPVTCDLSGLWMFWRPSCTD